MGAALLIYAMVECVACAQGRGDIVPMRSLEEVARRRGGETVHERCHTEERDHGLRQLPPKRVLRKGRGR